MARNIPTLWISTFLFTHNAHAGNVVVCSTEEHGSCWAAGAGGMI